MHQPLSEDGAARGDRGTNLRRRARPSGKLLPTAKSTNIPPHRFIHHYPDQPREPLRDQLRTGAHSNLGMFTMLRTEDEHRPGGLKIPNRAGEWVEVPAIPDSFVIKNYSATSSCDEQVIDRSRPCIACSTRPAIARWAAAGCRIPFFFYPNYDAVVECLPNCSSADNPPKYSPVTCGEYRRERISRVINFARKLEARTAASA